MFGSLKTLAVVLVAAVIGAHAERHIVHFDNRLVVNHLYIKHIY